jgi:hypothetical protein
MAMVTDSGPLIVLVKISHLHLLPILHTAATHRKGYPARPSLSLKCRSSVLYWRRSLYCATSSYNPRFQENIP